MMVKTPHVALFDDDSIPGSKVIGNALHMMYVKVSRRVVTVSRPPKLQARGLLTTGSPLLWTGGHEGASSAGGTPANA
jgi:hypothetical protein